jgi:mannose-1-phosphate guanylyltransferase/mannose-6-phosphate isomerase
LVESNVAYWASGISMFAARTIIEEYRKFDRFTADIVEQAVDQGLMAADGLELNAECFGQAISAPTESMVFEKTNRISMAPLDVNWSDVGSWTAMYGISKSNDQGNVLQGDVIAVETTNSMVRSTSRLVTVVGLKDIIVIDTPDALLVTRVGHCQSVKKVAEYLKAGKRVEAEKHLAAVPAASIPLKKPSDALFQSAGFEIKIARISAGASLELSAGQHREVLIASGEVIMSTAQSFSLLHTGQRIDVESETEATLYNASQSEAEVVLLTMHQSESAKATEPEKAQIVALYA